jgi:uridylate kinase
VRYRRVLVKLSGAAIAGPAAFGFDPVALNHIADQIVSVHEKGVQVGVVVGGGNIFRGELGEQWGIERAEADSIGMMATVTNSLMLRGVIEARGGVQVRVMTAIPINTVAEPFIRLRGVRHMEKGRIVILAAGTGNPYVTTDYPAVLRAIELRCEAILSAKHGVDGVYTSDPRVDPTARRYQSVDYDTVIQRNLQAMDQSAVLLARDYGLPIHVFDFDRDGAMVQLCEGRNVGTLIASEPGVLASADA